VSSAPAKQLNITLVVASCGSRLDWLSAMLQLERRLEAVVLEQCIFKSSLRERVRSRRARVIRVPRCGREAGSYLHYLTKHWHNLPPHMVFLQGDARLHWPGAAHAAVGVRQLQEITQGPASFVMLDAATPRGAPYSVTSSTCQHGGGGPQLIWDQLQGGPSPLPTLRSYPLAQWYLRRSRLAGGRVTLASFTSLLRLFDASSGNESSECTSITRVALDSEGLPHSPRSLASSFERMWPAIWGCSEPLDVATEAGSEVRCEEYKRRLHGQDACLVHGESSCLGCSHWHQHAPAPAATNPAPPATTTSRETTRCPAWPASVTVPKACTVYLRARVHSNGKEGTGHFLMALVTVLSLAARVGLTADVALPRGTPHNALPYVLAGTTFTRRDPACTQLAVNGSQLWSSPTLASDLSRAAHEWRRTCDSRYSCASVTVMGFAPPTESGWDAYWLRAQAKKALHSPNGGLASGESTRLKLAVHIRRGDLLNYLAALPSDQERSWQAKARLIPNDAYVALISDIVRRLRKAEPSQGVDLELHAEGGREHPVRVPDVDGDRWTDFSAFEHEWDATSVRLGTRSTIAALRSICASDVFVASPSGFSFAAALFCPRPLVLYVPFWLNYSCVPKAHALRRADEASLLVGTGKAKMSFALSSRIALPAATGAVLEALVRRNA